MKRKNIIWIVLAVIIAILIIAVGYSYYRKVTEVVKNPIVTMEVEEFGTIKLELYPDMAPNTVKAFIKNINDGYYNGLTFHRVIKDFMIQGGDKEGTGTTKLDYALEGEFLANGYSQNTLKFERGILGMARGDYSSLGTGLTKYSYNSAGTQFFIMTQDSSSLNDYYTAFGKVIEGMEVVDAISNVEVTYKSSDNLEETPKDAEGNELTADKPLTPPVITSITVETFGINYGDPQTVEPFDYNSWVLQNYGIDLSTMNQ